jgi:hypothetical protein
MSSPSSPFILPFSKDDARNERWLSRSEAVMEAAPPVFFCEYKLLEVKVTKMVTNNKIDNLFIDTEFVDS